MMAATLTIAVLTCVTCAMLFRMADSDTSLVVNPRQITTGLTVALDVNCSFSLDQTSNMAAIISLIVSRTSDSPQNTSSELATINEFSDNINLLTNESVIATGVFSESDDSYINLHWDYPNAVQKGVYRCSAQGFDALGHLVTAAKETEVTAGEPSMDDLKNKVAETNVLINTLDQFVQNLNQELKQNFSQLAKRAQTSEAKLAHLEREKEARILEMFEFSFTYSNHTYYISRDRFHDYYTSLTFCRSFGGYLAEVNDEDEYFAIQGYLNTTSETNFTGLIISGTDERQEGTWVKPYTTESLPFVDWAPGQPDMDSDDCLSLFHNPWQMYDFECHEDPPHPSIRFMCEIPQV